MYIWNASEDQWPVVCMIVGAAPSSASLVAPLAHIGWPPRFEPKKFLKQVMKKERMNQGVYKRKMEDTTLDYLIKAGSAPLPPPYTLNRQLLLFWLNPEP